MTDLRIVGSGSTNIQLNSNGIYTLEYSPRSGGSEATITETAKLLITGASASAVAATIRQIEAALQQAAVYEDSKRGERIYVQNQPVNLSAAVQSVMKRGKVLLHDEVLTGWQWGSHKVEISVIWEREGEWEDVADTAVPLTNGNGTNVTTGINVYNCNDGVGAAPNKRNNYVEIGSTAILGSRPGVCRIEATNQYNSATRLNNVWIAHNIYSDPANFQHVLEGEAVSYGGTTVANSGCSGGNYRSFTWVGDTQQIIARWLLDSTYLSRAAGRWFKVLAAFVTSPDNIRLQCKITFPAGTPLTVVSTSQEVLMAAPGIYIREIGTLQIPPWLAGETDLYPVDLSLYARKVGGGTLGIDYLQITPLDSYRLLTPRGYGLDYQTRIVDDGINDLIWSDGWSGTQKTGHYTAEGERVKLWPGMTQRLCFLQASGSIGMQVIDRLLNVKVYYRARYGSI